MAASSTLELSGSLSINPSRFIETTNILVQCLGQEGAGGDGAVRAVRLLVLAMSLVEYHSPDTVEVFKRRKINIPDDHVP